MFLEFQYENEFLLNFDLNKLLIFCKCLQSEKLKKKAEHATFKNKCSCKEGTKKEKGRFNNNNLIKDILIRKRRKLYHSKCQNEDERLKTIEMKNRWVCMMIVTNVRCHQYNPGYQEPRSQEFWRDTIVTPLTSGSKWCVMMVNDWMPSIWA